MKEKGQVRLECKIIFNPQEMFHCRLHTGGYSVVKRENEKYDFQIVHHYIDLTELTLNKLPVSSQIIIFLFNSLSL